MFLVSTQGAKGSLKRGVVGIKYAQHQPLLSRTRKHSQRRERDGRTNASKWIKCRPLTTSVRVLLIVGWS
jgi:hypothetical protein